MAAAAVLAVVFAWAGAAKLALPAATAEGFAGLGLPRPKALARVVPGAELLLAVALLAAPAVGGVAALVLLVGFSAVMVRALSRGVPVRCACFGQAFGPPLSSVDLVRNGLLAFLAGLASAGGREPHMPTAGAMALIGLATLVGLGVLVVLRGSRYGPTDGGGQRAGRR